MGLKIPGKVKKIIFTDREQKKMGKIASRLDLENGNVSKMHQNRNTWIPLKTRTKKKRIDFEKRVPD